MSDNNTNDASLRSPTGELAAGNVVTVAAGELKFPIMHTVTFHFPTGDRVQMVEEFAPGLFRVGPQTPVGPQITLPSSKETGFFADGRPDPAAGKMINMPAFPGNPAAATSLAQDQDGIQIGNLNQGNVLPNVTDPPKPKNS